MLLKAYADRFDTLDMSKLRESNQIALDKSEQDVNMARIKPRTQNQIKQSNPDEENIRLKMLKKAENTEQKLHKKQLSFKAMQKLCMTAWMM